MRLVAEALREPAFPDAEFEKMQRERAASIDEQRADPESVAERALSRWNNPYVKGDVRYVPTFDEELADNNATTLPQVKAFYARFVGGANAELAIVGDFDPAAVRALATELFGEWKSPAPYARVPNPFRPPAPTVLSATMPDKANAALFGRLPLPINDQSEDFPTLMLVDKILGASPESRIPDRIREREGLSYAIQTYLAPSSFEANTPMYLYAIFAPENRDRVRKGVAEEMARALKDGFTEAEVATAKTALLQARRISRAQDGSLGAALASQAYLGRTWEFTGKIDAALAAVTASQVNSVLRKYVDPNGFACRTPATSRRRSNAIGRAERDVAGSAPATRALQRRRSRMTTYIRINPARTPPPPAEKMSALTSSSSGLLNTFDERCSETIFHSPEFLARVADHRESSLKTPRALG